MQIYINRAGQQLGPYSIDDTKEYLRMGNLVPTDLAWHEGMPTWKPLSVILGISPTSYPPPIPPAIPPVTRDEKNSNFYTLARLAWAFGTALIVFGWTGVVSVQVSWIGFVISLIAAALTWIRPR